MNFFSFTRVLAVLAKEFTQLTRDRLTYAMILVLPVVQLLLFGYAINDTPRHLPTAVLVQEDTVFARSVLAAVRNSSYFDLTATARTPAELDTMLQRGTVQFAVTIPGDFSRRVIRGEDPQILIEADASDPSATGPAVAALAGLPAQALERDLVGLPAARGAVSAPFSVVVHNLYNPDSVSAYNIVPGLLGVILSMTLVLITALAVTRERERGTMEFLLATPVQPLEVMVGKLSPYVIVGLLQTAVVLLLAYSLFQVPMRGGWLGLGAGILLFIVGSLALGFLISTVARSQLQAMQMAMFYILPSILLSGFMFPYRGMPGWAQVVGSAIPVTYFLRIVRGALLKGQTLADAWPSLAALGVFVCVVTALTIARYQRTLD
ncbi:MAG TPA: ABC transporter permease [Caulobacteraceae bacterium]|jgi:ABC-2 type transport system permease protein|nr:ABC transporter permease [Caulobacteraceae bacterium]